MAKKHSCINVNASAVEGISLSKLPLPTFCPLFHCLPWSELLQFPGDSLYWGMYQLADTSCRNLPSILNVVIADIFCLRIECKTSTFTSNESYGNFYLESETCANWYFSFRWKLIALRNIIYLRHRHFFLCNFS